MSSLGTAVPAAKGCVLVSRDGTRAYAEAVSARETVDRTGAGDGFRAGFLDGVSRGLAPVRATQPGSLAARHPRPGSLRSPGMETGSRGRADPPAEACGVAAGEGITEITPVVHGNGC